MADERDSSRPYRLWPLDRRIVAGGALTGVVVLGVVAGFAYAGGLLSPGRLTQAGLIDTFQEVNGIHPGFRRNHAKGVCVTGWFESNGAGAKISEAAVFAAGRSPVAGRFSLAGGKPFAADSEADVFALAVSFRPPDGEEWRTAMIDIPVFPVRDAEGFRDFLLATQPVPSTGAPDPAKMQAFLAAHPEAPAALGLIGARTRSSGFETATYNALHAFLFVDAAGTATPVRWSAVADEPVGSVAPGPTPTEPTPTEPTPTEPAPTGPTAAAPAGAEGKDFLFDDLIARIGDGPVRWRLVLTLGRPGDPTADSSVPWPADRERLDVGTIMFDHIETEAPGNCRDVNFDPLVLPAGIEPSDDPLLSARSATYSISFTRRTGEKKTPSEVQVPETDRGT